MTLRELSKVLESVPEEDLDLEIYSASNLVVFLRNGYQGIIDFVTGRYIRIDE